MVSIFMSIIEGKYVGIRDIKNMKKIRCFKIRGDWEKRS